MRRRGNRPRGSAGKAGLGSVRRRKEKIALHRIYHITSVAAWRSARAKGVYRATSLASEGFIHCSTREQVPRTARRHFSDHSDLVVLVIDPRAVDCEVRFEWAPSVAEVFPHIYGPLTLSAVVEVLDLPSGGDATSREWWRERPR